MEALLCVRASATLADTAALMRKLKVRAEPLHPGVKDAALARWHVLRGDPADLAAAVQALAAHAAVEAAYIKPEGEAPGGLPP